MAAEKHARAVWNGNMSFTAHGSTAPQYTVPFDSDESVGGGDDGFRPLEMVLMGLAGCTAMDVISIMRKKKQDVTAFEVAVDGIQVDEYPMVFDHVTLTFKFWGNNLDPAAVERSIELSETRYCPVSAILRPTATLETRYEIYEAEPTPEV